jgi:2-methylcitrate dehydratase PrpD
MTQPFIDCAIALAAQGVRADDIVKITCDVGEGTVHRLWEPLAVKHRPQTPYAAKFSTPFCMAIGFLDGKAGLSQFSEARIADPQAQELAAKISYVINPEDPYPDNFTGQLKATLTNGETRVLQQDHMRGGAHAPMSLAEVEAKFVDNAIYGGWTAEAAEAARAGMKDLFVARDTQLVRSLRA